jgi:hypothetical protein
MFFSDLAISAASNYYTPEEGEALDRLEQEHDNLRAVLRWLAQAAPQDSDALELGLTLCASLGHFWRIHGHLTEGREFLGEFLTPRPHGGFTGSDSRSVDEQASVARAAALREAGSLAFLHGEANDARHYMEASLAMWRRLEHRPGIASVLNDLGPRGRITSLRRRKPIIVPRSPLRKKLVTS